MNDRTRICVVLGTGLWSSFSKEFRYKKLRIRNQFGIAYIAKTMDNQFGPQASIYFIPRHGYTQNIPAHLINYRANFAALKSLRIDYVISTSTVGAINKKIKSGEYVIIDQFIDQTRNRTSTMYTHRGAKLIHTDMTTPYSPEVRRALLRSLRENMITSVRSKGTYICTEGPRFETPAEIRMYRSIGGDVVGMTGVPEVVLAKELSIPYAAICLVTNLAAGLQHEISHVEVLFQVKKKEEEIKRIIVDAISFLSK
jgi:5'-methylthioadenosine phosphorylase